MSSFGAGMGLSNVRACADQMTLTSKLGEGTRLEMVFVLAKGSGQ